MNTVIGTDISQAAEKLKAGEVVGIPTETVYGLAANALDEEAVARIFEVKQRPRFDPLIIHLHTFGDVKRYVTSVPDIFKELGARFTPGPLTFILPKREIIPDLVTSGNPTVAVRIPSHPLTRELLKQTGFPLAAPSANPFGYISPTTADHVKQQLGGRIPFILDGGACRVGVESTIISEENGKVIIQRLGGLDIDEIGQVAGKVVLRIQSSGNPQSPGQIKVHYAPRIPLYFGGDILGESKGYKPNQWGYLAFRHYRDDIPRAQQRILSPAGDLREAATHLFRALRELDMMDLDGIVAESFPEEGLGLAINDRLRRASLNH